MSGHTPGKWIADIDCAHHRAVVRVGMMPIAEIWMTGQSQAEREANARLIAAAPSLLEALQKVLPLLAHRGCGFTRPTSEWAEHGSMNFDNCDCEIRLVRAAIASATGAES